MFYNNESVHRSLILSEKYDDVFHCTFVRIQNTMDGMMTTCVVYTHTYPRTHAQQFILKNLKILVEEMRIYYIHSYSNALQMIEKE